jgi:hypothetical protein
MTDLDGEESIGNEVVELECIAERGCKDVAALCAQRRRRRRGARPAYI